MLISGYGASFAIRMDVEMGIRGNYTDHSLYWFHCNSLPENEEINDYP